MNPGIVSPTVSCPTIAPLSLIPKAVADEPPGGMKVVSAPLDERINALPFPSVPTTVPEELIPKAMAVVDPLMFKTLTNLLL